MKKIYKTIYFPIMLFICNATAMISLAQSLSNNAVIVVPADKKLNITGDFINNADGSIILNGQINLSGDWINLGDTLSLGGVVDFHGSSNKHIRGEGLTIYNHLIIHDNSTVIVGENHDETRNVTVLGTFTNHHGGDGFILRSGASLLHYTAGVAASVERTITGAEMAWHMLSSPLAAQDIAEGFDDGSFFTWYEPAQTWVSFKNNIVWPTWHFANNGLNDFIPAKGYMAAYPYSGTPAENQTKTFAGEMNQGEMNFSLQHQAHPDDAHQGFNLLGNPYPSSIDWKAESGWSGRENLQTPGGSGGYNIWIWNAAENGGNYGVYNSGQTEDHGTLGVSRYIAPMQAFWVRAGVHEGILGMNNNVRVHSGQEWLKRQQSTPGIIRMMVSGSANSWRDEIIIEYGHHSDQGGAQKLFSIYIDAPGLYSQKHNDIWSISFLTSISEHPIVPIGFRSGVEAIYTISVTGADFFEEVILEDLYSGIKQILNYNSQYHFSSSPSDPDDRFLLHFKALGINDAFYAQPDIHVNRNMLYVLNPWHNKASISMYDASGRLVQHFEINPKSNSQLRLSLHPGIYFIRMLDESRLYTKKLMVM